MKYNFNVLTYICIFISLNVLMFEHFNVQSFITKLTEKDEISATPAVGEALNQENDYYKSQISSGLKKLRKIKIEIGRLFVMTVLVYLFFNQQCREKMTDFCNFRLNIFGSFTFYIARRELNIICLFLIAFLFNYYGKQLINIFIDDFDNLFIEIIFVVLMIVIVVPYLVALVYNLLRSFNVTFIYAVYIALFISTAIDIFIQEEIDLTEFEKVDINEFSDEVIGYLKSRGLENKVYREIKASDSINAALVGWGKYEHIEILGNHEHFTSRQFESVLMHEIGHSADYSLFKKIFTFFVIKLLEMLIVVFLFRKLTHDYRTETLTEIGAFMILFTIFEISIMNYLNIFQKLISQNAENYADNIAKKHGFGKELGKVLINITVKTNEFISTTWIYNLFTSFHPTILSRITNLITE